MKRAILGMMCVWSMTASTNADGMIGLVDAGAMDKDLLERVCGYAQQETRLVVQAREIEARPFATLEAATGAIKDMRKENETMIIGLVSCEADLHAHYETNHLAATINVTALKTDNRETYARRVERQVMRAIAFLAGLEPSPDPLCVTRHYTTLKDLDSMGRNYSPPWLFKLQELSREKGLEPVQP